MSKLTHRIEKKAVEILVDRIMAERNPADRQKTLKRLSYVMQHLFGDLFEKESFDDARRLIDEGGQMVPLPQYGSGYLEPACRQDGRHGPGL